MQVDLVSCDVMVSVEDEGVAIGTSVGQPYPASGTTIGIEWQQLFAAGRWVPLRLCADRFDARLNRKDPAFTNIWKIVVQNTDPLGGAIFRTTVQVDILTDRVVRIVILPVPAPVI